MDRWDERFLAMADLVASWSKDPSTQCGAIIVRPDRTVASVGFNGFPRGCSDADQFYADRDKKLSRVIHSELNAILHAREPLAGYTMYVTPLPTCDRCAAHIVQAGIARVVWRPGDPERVARWEEQIVRGLEMYAEAGVEVVPFIPCA